jgi:hypothetical protein
VTADAAGYVDGVVRIPLSATGFVPEGAAAGIVFLDVIGAGSAADIQDDIAMADVFAAGYPQSTPVSCTSPGEPASGEPTATASNGSPPPANEYNYVWKTDPGWRGCRMLIVKLVDGSYHRALFNFGS